MINLNSNTFSFLSADVNLAMTRGAKICQDHIPNRFGIDTEIIAAIENSRNQVASLLHTNPQMLFFHGFSQQNEIALILSLISFLGIEVVISSASEDSHKLEILKELESLGKIKLIIIGINQNGSIDISELSNLLEIEEQKKLITLSHANKFTGELLPVKEIRSICKDNEVIFHLNTNLTIGRYIIDFAALLPDFMSFGCNLEHGPEDIGAIIINHEIKISEEEFNSLYKYFKATESKNLSLILGFERAIGMAIDKIEFNREKLKKLKEYLIAQLNLKLNIEPIHVEKVKEGLINLVPITISSELFGKLVSEKLNLQDISIESIEYPSPEDSQISIFFIPIALNDEITENEIDYFIEALSKIKAQSIIK